MVIFAIAAAIGLTIAIYFIVQQKLKHQEGVMHHQLQNLRYELNTKTNAIEIASYVKEKGEEIIIYNSSDSNMRDDFTGQGAREWNYVSHQFSNETGQGSHQVKDGVITIERSNTLGRYELYLKRYGYENSSTKIPAHNSINKRKLRISCEVKRSNASHLLRFVFKGEHSQNVLDEKDYVVFNPGWEQLNLVFTISAHEASYLRIDDLSVLKAPSLVQIRNIILYEKK